MSSYNQQMVLRTIDTTSQRIKAGNLEVLAWLEYWMIGPRKSELYSDSVSLQFLRQVRGMCGELKIGPLFNDHRIVAASSLFSHPIDDNTWGAVDLVANGSFYLVAVFNNGALSDTESKQLTEALSRMKEIMNLNDLVSWQSWGGYSSIRTMFKSFYHKQLGR